MTTSDIRVWVRRPLPLRAWSLGGVFRLMLLILSRLTLVLLVAATAVGALVGVRGLLASGPVTLSGFSPAETTLVHQVMVGFAERGLVLPETHMIRGPDADRCGRRGYTRETWPVAIVVICTANEAVVAHELAHAWLNANLDRGRRHEWMDRRGAATWSSRSVPWHDRANEHAADIITWYVLWQSEDRIRGRVSGENTAERYLSDVQWLTGIERQ